MSLGHSGSTVLGLMLGSHSRLVALGEVSNLIPLGSPWLRRTADVTCTCGHKMDDCVFWGPTCQMLRASTVEDPKERYAMVLESFWDQYDDTVIPLDTSKVIPPLRLLREIGGMEVAVLLLMRDVRSWTVSVRDVRRRNGEFLLRDLLRKHGLGGLRHYPKRVAAALFMRWYLGNRAFQNYLSATAQPFHQLGYEELCLYPSKVLGRICDYLGIEMTEAMLTPSGTESHSVLGNRMRVQKPKRSALMYDHRWFTRSSWLLPSFIFRSIMRYNAKNVYHLSDATWTP